MVRNGEKKTKEQEKDEQEIQVKKYRTKNNKER